MVMFDHRYGPAEINQFDLMGSSYRTGMARIPDPRNLGEALRTIGRLLDASDAQLISPNRDNNLVVVEYRDKNQQRQRETFEHHALYKLQQRYYTSRQPGGHGSMVRQPMKPSGDFLAALPRRFEIDSFAPPRRDILIIGKMYCSRLPPAGRILIK